jgi:hypothetical protein
MIDTPVLFLIFNRPAETLRVFERIRMAKPLKLYIAADGPRLDHEGEDLLCVESREIVHQVDWDCDVKTLFRSENLGCKIAVTQAVDWFFENEEMGIILEDDTLPSQSFFEYCRELLIKYRYDVRVMKIAGFNPLSQKLTYPFDYFFSYYSFTWGWASWRRAWLLNDIEMNNWSFIDDYSFNKYYPFDPDRNLCFEQVMKGLDTWDYQWDFAMLCQNGLQIVPARSLIRNIGFGESATHTTKDYFNRGLISGNEMTFPMRMPPEMVLPYVDFEKKLIRQIAVQKRISLGVKMRRQFTRFLKLIFKGSD